MPANFSIDYSQFEELERNVQQLPNRAEKILNDTLKVKVSPILQDSIIGGMPVSKRKKKHAKFFKSLTSDNKENLTITIKPKPRFKYLVFPDLGIGTSKKRAQQKFMEHGVDREVNKSVEELNLALLSEINRTLGGS
ncbi:TPA: hypothetical protein ROX98_000506 [Bacillus pseudomycoides]|nr:hypothetical protein [Bacillus pseudomycoides]